MAKCKLGQIFDSSDLSKGESLALESALEQTQGDNYVWSARKLAAAVNQTRFSIGATTVKDHRRKDCACFQ